MCAGRAEIQDAVRGQKRESNPVFRKSGRVSQKSNSPEGNLMGFWPSKRESYQI